jgi:hypothetical protein
MRICCFILSLFISGIALGQTVTVGTSSTTTTYNPLKSNSSYSYTQQLYLANEGTATTLGTQANKYVTAIRFYWAGTGTLANSGTWAVYLGNTAQNTFTATSWVTSANMTLVFSGAVSLPASAGWMTINLATPFLYTGNNLVVAVDENTIGASANLATWRFSTTSASYRSIYISGTTNYSPAAPTAGTITYNRPNIQFDFYVPPSPTSISASQAVICPGGSSVLTAVGNSGTTYWFTSSCGNSIATSIGSGASLTVNPASTTIYYCRNYSNGMWSATCASTTVTVSSIPNTPPAPTSNSPFCGNVTINAAAPPAGVNWYWQTTSTGTSMAHTGNSYSVNASGTYYLRALNSNGCWSANSSPITVTVYPVPNTPPTPTSNSPFCGNVTISATAPPAGVNWYWQTTSTGTSMANTGNSYSVNASGAYYLRARSTNGCWSINSSTFTVSVLPVPASPAIPSSNSPQCDSVLITRLHPPLGETWFWQGTNQNGVSTVNSSITYNAVASGTYYLRSVNAQGCWSAASSIAITVHGRPSAPGNPISNSPQCTMVTMNWLNSPPAGVTWYWQTAQNGTSTANATSQFTSNVSGVFYLRAVNAGGCWSLNSGSISAVVTGFPFAPNVPLSTSPSCDSVVLTMSGLPPNGVNWYWQGLVANGASTVNSNVSTVVYTSGTYYLRARNTANCWSAQSTPIAVTVYQPTTSSIAPTACDVYTAPDGQVFTASGQYQAIIPNHLGCDSTISIQLQINPSHNVWDAHIACDSFTWIDGVNYVVDNNSATFTYQNIYGCDSIIHLDLDVVATPDTVVIYSTVIDDFEFNGIHYNQAGTYFQAFNTQYGCDSIIQVVLNFEYTDLNILEFETSVYPNPSLDGVFYLPNLPQNCTLDLYDVLGRAVPFKWDSGRLVILNLNKGEYFITCKQIGSIGITFKLFVL